MSAGAERAQNRDAISVVQATPLPRRGRAGTLSQIIGPPPSHFRNPPR
jgi:hypothetical protein